MKLGAFEYYLVVINVAGLVVFLINKLLYEPYCHRPDRRLTNHCIAIRRVGRHYSGNVYILQTIPIKKI